MLLVLAVLRQGMQDGPEAASSPPGSSRTAETRGGASDDPPARAPVPAAEREALAQEVEGIVARWVKRAQAKSNGRTHAGNVEVAVHAIELGPRREGVLTSRLADRALTPASNMKLVTTAAALTLLGPGWSFETPFEAAGPLEGGVLDGDLVVRAGGDPLADDLGSGRVEDRLDPVVEALRAAGLTRIGGDLVLDEEPYGEPSPAPGWPDASQHWDDYCALSGGFTVNGGVLTASLRATGGESLQVEVRPAPFGLRSNFGVRLGSKNDVRVGATPSACTVKGQLPASAVEGWSASFSHPDPVDLFGSVLAARLARGGIELAGEVRHRRGAPAGEHLATLTSPLEAVLVPINTHSTNGVADQVFLTLGAQVVGAGTRAGGMAATRRAFETLGVPTDGFVQADGSGLSRDNRVSARQIVALLESVQRMETATREAFFGSLAVAGQTGTLGDRLGGTAAEGRVFAKTGWIRGASSLSGLARTVDGREVLFSILVGYPRDAGGLNRDVFKPMQDELVLALVEGQR